MVVASFATRHSQEPPGTKPAHAWEAQDRGMQEQVQGSRPAEHETGADQLAAKLGRASLGMDVPPTPETAQRGLSASLAEACSPRTIASLAAAASASLQSSDPSTPLAPGSTASSSGAGSGSQQTGVAGVRGSGRGSHASNLSPVGSAGDLLAGAAEQPPLEVDLEFLCDRLKRGPLTGQVVAWGWEQAARLSVVRRTMPNQLFSSLWAATDVCITRMTAQDVVEILESWSTILQQCSRHFRFAVHTVHGMAIYTMPAAIKRMDERQLAQVASLCRDMALMRNEADLSASQIRKGQGGGASGSSPRDLLQPVFGLVAAEAAWRCNNSARYVSPASVRAILAASKAWRWRVVRHRDSQQLVVLKDATEAALALLTQAEAQAQAQDEAQAQQEAAF